MCLCLLKPKDEARRASGGEAACTSVTCKVLTWEILFCIVFFNQNWLHASPCFYFFFLSPYKCQNCIQISDYNVNMTSKRGNCFPRLAFTMNFSSMKLLISPLHAVFHFPQTRCCLLASQAFPSAPSSLLPWATCPRWWSASPRGTQPVFRGGEMQSLKNFKVPCVATSLQSNEVACL